MTPVTEAGQQFCLLESADRSVSVRLAKRVYEALRLLDVHRGFAQWSAAVMSANPGVSAQQLSQMISSLAPSGLFDEQESRPPSPEGATESLPAVVPEEPHAQEAVEKTQIAMALPDEVTAFLKSEEFKRIEGAEVSKKLSREVTSITRARIMGPPRGRLPSTVERVGTGLVRAMSPSTGRPVLLFEAEHALLTAMSGTTSFTELLGRAEALGYPLTPNQLAALVRDLSSFGFIEDTAGAEASAPLLFIPLVERGRTQEVPVHSRTEAERSFFQSGVSMFRQFAFEEAEAFFLAALDSNPTNREARILLVALEHVKAALGGKQSTLAVAPSFATDSGADEDHEPEGGESGEPDDDDGQAEVAEGVEDSEAASEGGDNIEAYGEAAEEVEHDRAAVQRRWARRLKRMARAMIIPAVIVGAGFLIKVPLTLTYPCVIRPVERDVIRSPLDGVIEEVLVDEGQRVSKGDIVARLLATDLQLAVVKSESAIQRAQAELDLLRLGSREEEVARAEARVAGLARETSIASDRVARLRGQVKNGVAPRDELDRANAERAALSGQLAQARAELRLQRAGARPDEIRRKEAELMGLRAQHEVENQNLEKTLLKARKDGIVITPKPKDLVNAKVSQGQEVLEVVLPSVMRTEVLVAERDFDVLALDMPMSVKVASLPGAEFGGRITKLGQRVERVDGLNVVRAEGKIENDNGALMPNMTGYAKIEGSEVSVTWMVVRRLVRWVRVRFLI